MATSIISPLALPDGGSLNAEEHKILANDCLLEIASLANIVRGLAEPHLGDGLGRSVSGMLRRIERLTELACICWDDDPQRNCEMSLEQLRSEIMGSPPASLNAGESLIR